MRRKICRGVDEIINIHIDGKKRHVYIYYLANEEMLGVTSWYHGPVYLIWPTESSMLTQIFIEIDPVVTREEWMLLWLEGKVEAIHTTAGRTVKMSVAPGSY